MAKKKDIEVKKHPADNFGKLPDREEQKRFWKWRVQIGSLLKKEVPKDVLIPVTKEKYLEMYKEGLQPHEVRDYIIYQLL